MCAQLVEQEPRSAGACALMSRLCLLGGDVAAALSFASVAVRIAPDDPQGRAALQSALMHRPDPARGQRFSEEALALEPRILAYVECYGSALAFEHIERVRELLEDAVRLDPGLAVAHAALANVLSRQNHRLQAIAGYRRALDFDPDQPDAALALSELLFDIGDTAESDAYRAQALARKRLYPAGPQSANAGHSVLVLNAPAAWAQNTPLEFMIDPQRVALHRLYLTGEPADAALPEYDVVFNAVGEAERAHGALALAQQFIDGQDKRVINQPRHLWKTARPNVARALANVRGCVVPVTRRVTREELRDSADFPLLARPIDTHAGRGLERLSDREALRDYLERHADERFDAVPFVEYRSDDGYYRKYRVILIDGKPHAYHLGISPDWMVHYIKTPTAGVDWMRAEEERFLREPQAVFPAWERSFGEIARAFELDYVGIDCALLRDGSVLVFEADTALLVHCRERADSYKHRYVPKIFAAAEALLTKR